MDYKGAVGRMPNIDKVVSDYPNFCFESINIIFNSRILETTMRMMITLSMMMMITTMTIIKKLMKLMTRLLGL